MTASDWLTSTDVQSMLQALRGCGRASPRKQRLLLTACGRRLWPLLCDRRSRQAVEVAERFADGEAGPEELGAASAAAHVARDVQRASPPHPLTSAAYVAIETCRPDPLRLEITLLEAVRAVTQHAAATGNGAARRDAHAGERAYQATLLRDLFGPQPSCPIPPLPAAVLGWGDGLVAELARAAYEHRLLLGHLDPSRLAVLCDGLLDAGCSDAELLGHLQGAGPHWRGCWALDSVMGKA